MVQHNSLGKENVWPPSVVNARKTPECLKANRHRSMCFFSVLDSKHVRSSVPSLRHESKVITWFTKMKENITALNYLIHTQNSSLLLWENLCNWSFTNFTSKYSNVLTYWSLVSIELGNLRLPVS